MLLSGWSIPSPGDSRFLRTILEWDGSAQRLRPGLRSFPVGNYRIYYRQEDKGVVRVLYVRHAARDEKTLFG
jgi:ParE toxin of type II toxin-antitoxin system, parDE